MSSKTAVKDFVFQYFTKIGSIPGKSEKDRLKFDYVQSQMLDSLGILNLITDIESKFKIVLQGDDLESPAFKTIGGLIQTIESKLKTASKT
jgi:acyl carrier protein